MVGVTVCLFGIGSLVFAGIAGAAVEEKQGEVINWLQLHPENLGKIFVVIQLYTQYDLSD